MGLLDLPAPIFSAADSALDSILPPVGRLIVWAALAALLSMELYRLLSPQAKIVQLRRDLQAAQKQLAGFDGEFDEAWPLIGRTLKLAVERVFAVLPSAVAASLPILTLIVWLDDTYSHTLPPPGQPAQIEVQQPFTGKWRDGSPDGGRPHAVVMAEDGKVVVDKPIEAAIPVLHKRQWWNVLIGNPAGYLEGDAPIDRIAIDLPTAEVLAAGPAWLRGWQATFFVGLLIFALAVKWIRQIE